MLDHQYIFERAEEVIQCKESLKLRAYSASSVPYDERIYTKR